MNYLEHIFALATFTLPVFLQVMAALAILSVWRPLGKPKLLSGRSIFIVNLDQAIRNNESGSLEQMEEVANAIAKSNDGVERLIYFYGDLEGDLRVNESLARWSEKDPRHGPIVNMSDEEQRWANELVYEKWSLGIREGASPPDTEKQDRFPFERNRINELIKELAEQYFYRPSSKWHNKAIDRSSQVMVDQDIDGHAYICNVVDRVCVNDQQKTQVLQSLNFGAIKTLNIYQVQSE